MQSLRSPDPAFSVFTVIMSAPDRYSAIAVALHWTIALCILALFGLGIVMTSLPPSDLSRTFALYQLHKSLGITVLLLTVARLVWRLTHPAPPLPESMSLWERRAAQTVHAAFYVLLLLIPLVGWALVSSSPLNIPTVLFGAIPWPHLPVLPDLPYKKEVEAVLKDVHGALAYGAAVLMVLHIGAALKHHFITRDNILARMIPILKRG